MNRLIKLGFGLLTILALASFGTPQDTSPAFKNAIAAEDAAEVQVRGPLHEAFAQPLDMNPEPGAVVPKAPPPPIPEEPPTERPDVANAEWIPGYWAWDAERNDYIWVSGVYRVPPQGRTFIPGYWEQTTSGYRWISGFWSNDNQQDIVYTPQPPAPLENGPSMPAPDDNSIYVPGTWIYRDGRFVWRPGYYAAAQPGREWVPARYLWTPRGYVYVDSYWDVPFDDRGMVFAPVYFSQPYWNNPGWSYRPNFLVSLAMFFDSAFCRPGYGHYYYGNYYGNNYARYGYRPWFNGGGRYDPIFAYHGWQNRHSHPNWAANQQALYASRASGRAAVPPMTLAQQRTQVTTHKASPVVTPVTQVQNTKVRVVAATTAQQQVHQKNVQQVRSIALNRQKMETVAPSKNSPQTIAAHTSTLVPRSKLVETKANVAPRIQTPITTSPSINVPRPSQIVPPLTTPKTAPGAKSPPTPRSVTPAPAVKSPPTPRSVTPAPAPQRTVPQFKETQSIPRAIPVPKASTPIRPPTVATPTAPRTVIPQSKAPSIPARPAPVVAPKVTPRPSAPAPLPRVSVPSAPPRVQSPPRVSAPSRPAAPAPRVSVPSAPPRVQAPRVQAPPRVSAPPRPAAPSRSSPPPRSAPHPKGRR